MSEKRIGIIMHGVTGRMGTNQHLLRSILAIRKDGGVRLADGTRIMWEEKRDPYDLPAAHIFKITGGEIHEVEALGIFVPYGSPTGWE